MYISVSGCSGRSEIPRLRRSGRIVGQHAVSGETKMPGRTETCNSDPNVWDYFRVSGLFGVPASGAGRERRYAGTDFPPEAFRPVRKGAFLRIRRRFCDAGRNPPLRAAGRNVSPDRAVPRIGRRLFRRRDDDPPVPRPPPPVPAMPLQEEAGKFFSDGHEIFRAKIGHGRLF